MVGSKARYRSAVNRVPHLQVHTIMDSDKILVLDAGKIGASPTCPAWRSCWLVSHACTFETVEFDTPEALIANPNSEFNHLVAAAGAATAGTGTGAGAARDDE